MAENENVEDVLLDEIDAELATINMAESPLAPALPPPPPPPPPPPAPVASPATADGPYVACHARSGWRVRAQQQSWAAVQLMMAQALILRTIVQHEYRGRGRGRGVDRGQGRGGHQK